MDKTKQSSAAAQDAVSFAALADVIWLGIASYLIPPDVYRLALTSKHFHLKQQPNDNNDNSDSDNDNTPLLATRLLRESLLVSLGRILDHTKSGITLEAALQLGQGLQPKSSVLIAGSVMAQTCLGVLWDSADVDLYSSSNAAPHVRSWLVEKANAVFIGFKDYALSIGDTDLSYTVDTKLHHVEHYGSVSGNYRICDTKCQSEAEYLQKITEFGQNIQETYTKWKWGIGSNVYALLGIDTHDPHYKIQPKPDGNLPFDFEGDGNIDLCVAKKKANQYDSDDDDDDDEPPAKKPKAKGAPSRNEEEDEKGQVSDDHVTPFDILQDFDLTICKVSFDGTTFRIPHPHLVFAGKSAMEPLRKIVVESYAKHWMEAYQAQGSKRVYGELNQAAIARETILAVEKDLMEHGHYYCRPLFELVDIAEVMPDHSIPDRPDGFEFGAGTIYDPYVQMKHGRYVQFHNWVFKLVTRLRKYQSRGIEVVNAPSLPVGFEMHQFHFG